MTSSRIFFVWPVLTRLASATASFPAFTWPCSWVMVAAWASMVWPRPTYSAVTTVSASSSTPHAINSGFTLSLSRIMVGSWCRCRGQDHPYPRLCRTAQRGVIRLQVDLLAKEFDLADELRQALVAGLQLHPQAGAGTPDLGYRLGSAVDGTR